MLACMGNGSMHDRHNIASNQTLITSSTVGSCCQYDVDSEYDVDVDVDSEYYVDSQYATTNILPILIICIPTAIIAIVLLLNLLAIYKCCAKCMVYAKGIGQGEAEEGEVNGEGREEEETHPYEEVKNCM
jgi:hypothetical protein